MIDELANMGATAAELRELTIPEALIRRALALEAPRG